MKLSLPTTLLTTLALTSAAPAPEAQGTSPAPIGPYFLTSYLTATCGTARGVSTFYQNTCKILDFPARAVQFQTTSGIPARCTLFGYTTDTCFGTSFLTITGPSQQGRCYPTSSGIGANAFIRSVRLQCSQ
ncbi:hypothetical protein BDZ85DRAFT_316225 [Elsinoe ampelina]|uniref:Uncharacterized protein n=1 Tax=Elsinoe ampelina TaxID=302913 RepID=A0A6A6GM48_9PEZI|nr:hypothetical protein BDZ85DRAFT_316225 [Elsinoe ampelina]